MTGVPKGEGMKLGNEEKKPELAEEGKEEEDKKRGAIGVGMNREMKRENHNC